MWIPRGSTLVFLGMAIGASPTGAAVHRVPAEQPTIQAGIDAAAAGDTVLVAPGTYTGDGNRSIDYAGKNLVVVSEAGAAFTIVDCQADSENPHRGFTFDSEEGPSAVLDGFTIVNGYMSSRPTGASAAGHPLSGGGITCQNSSPTIRNCIIRSCTSEYTGGGISIEFLSTATVTNCVVQGCVSGSDGGGISVESNAEPTITGCVVTGNKSKRGGGISCRANATIRSCVVSGNAATESGGGMESLYPASPVVERTIVWGNCAPETGGEIFVDNGASISFGCSALDAQKIVTAGTGQFHAAGSNVQIEPGLCNPRSCLQAPSLDGEYEISAASPCTPERSPCGELIGALGAGCDASPVTPASWGRLKYLFR